MVLNLKAITSNIIHQTSNLKEKGTSPKAPMLGELAANGGLRGFSEKVGIGHLAPIAYC